MNTLGPANIRHANALACIDAFRSVEEPLSISDIAARTGLSRPTIESVISGFEARGLVAEAAAAEAASSGGRPARRYALESTSSVVAGIDAGPRNVRVLIADLRGRIIARATKVIDGAPTSDERLAIVTAVTADALQRSGVSAANLQAACIAVSGIVGESGRLINSFAVPEWNGVAIAEHIADSYDCVAVLENDIKLAAYAEHNMGAAHDVDNILFIQIGNRISLSQTFDRQIFHGAHRSAGEVSSLRGMHWTKTSIKGQLTWRSGETAEQVFARASAGDETALSEVVAFIREIAPLLTTVSLVVDPARIVVGGGLSRAGDLFVDMLREEIHRLIVLADKPDVTASPLGSIGAATGALALAFQFGSESLFGIADVAVPAIVLDRETREIA
ncbi:ROK family transcriptional regulator [Microbacterium murale]|uniref:NBD/HSP70 family sugar kinase n=1 Tax=Microbacterium murale TaxID=1081040 RepID=A0ABU0PAG0_9MICO|nr:ROK family transcriptional regulator [Microbacterium murale]MDQ0643599.1 putative NBD/HSP70 family sugar kinase [Microbacterium murale]